MKLRIALTSAVLAIFSLKASATVIDLGTAGSFAALGGSKVANTGSTTIEGNLGVSPGSAVTGFLPGIVSDGTIHSADAVAANAQADSLNAYNVLAGLPFNTDLTGQDLGGLTLVPGVYHFDSSAQLTGALTLNALGEDNAVFIIQIGSTLTTASASSVNVINGGPGNALFWQVGSSATLGTGTTFEGNLIALQSITLTTGATIPCGRALALNAQLTLDTNDISITCTNENSTAGSGGTGGFSGSAATPEPGTFLLFVCCAGLFGLRKLHESGMGPSPLVNWHRRSLLALAVRP